MEPRFDSRIHEVGADGVLDISFITRLWRTQNEQMAGVMREKDAIIAGLEKDRDYYRSKWEESYSTRDQDYDEIERLRQANQTLREELTGFRLAEAWKKVDQEYLDELASKWFPNNKIPAIKEVREFTGLGLKEAKDLVDQDWAHRDLNGKLEDEGEPVA